MAFAVLAEIGRLLAALAESGATGGIDLRSLPLTAADRDQLEDLLGRGEVRAELDLAGPSEVWETTFPGAWWVRHLGADGRVATEVIAICPVPGILAAHPADIRAGAQRLSRYLEQQGSVVGGRLRPTEADSDADAAADAAVARKRAPTAMEKPHG
jgi:hydrogenase-1 operon protein HyaF